jgi:hypothetical protein
MKHLFLTLMAILSISTATAQTVVGDATLPNTMSLEGSDLLLNGAGMREKLWIDLYAGGLYLTAKSADAKAIINGDETMSMKLHIVSGMISSEKMIKAVDDGFTASLKGKTDVLASKIETFKGFFSEEITKNNVFDIAYIKGKGSVVYKDGKEVGMIEGLDFKKALFGIWLGAKPADKGLKNEMLGKN